MRLARRPRLQVACFSGSVCSWVHLAKFAILLLNVTRTCLRNHFALVATSARCQSEVQGGAGPRIPCARYCGADRSQTTEFLLLSPPRRAVAYPTRVQQVQRSERMILASAQRPGGRNWFNSEPKRDFRTATRSSSLGVALNIRRWTRSPGATAVVVASRSPRSSWGMCRQGMASLSTFV